MDSTICFLAANKCDEAASREVDEVEARLWAELHGFVYCETSANTGLGITDMFHTFFSQIVRLAESGLGSKTPKQGKRPVKINFTQFTKKSFLFASVNVQVKSNVRVKCEVIFLAEFFNSNCRNPSTKMFYK